MCPSSTPSLNLQEVERGQKKRTQKGNLYKVANYFHSAPLLFSTGGTSVAVGSGVLVAVGSGVFVAVGAGILVAVGGIAVAVGCAGTLVAVGIGVAVGKMTFKAQVTPLTVKLLGLVLTPL